jgi:DNA-binding MarR family transcriptional regulator
MSKQRQALDVGAALTRLTTAVGERVLEARAASGLSAIQLQVLRLGTRGATMSELAATLATPKSTVTSVVNQLEASGLARRARDDRDRRRQIVRATPVGSARLRDFDDAVAQRVDEMLTDLDPARTRRLRDLMARLPDATVPLPLAGPR